MLRTLIATAGLVALGCANQSGLAEHDDRPIHIRIQVRQMDGYVERSIQKALREIAWENDGYYDLQVTAPLGAKILNLSLTIKVDYQISVETYSLEKGHVPSVALQYGKW